MVQVSERGNALLSGVTHLRASGDIASQRLPVIAGGFRTSTCNSFTVLDLWGRRPDSIRNVNTPTL